MMPLPQYLAISRPAIEGSDADWLAAGQAQIARLSQQFSVPVALQLRPLRPVPSSIWQALLAEAAAAGILPWLNADWALVDRLGARAIHLNHTRLMAGTRAQVAAFQAAGGRVSAACHDAVSLRRAEALGVDAVLLSPVLPTSSHPGAPVLGWAGFAQLARSARPPVYALGGVTPADLPTARAHGGYGVAGIGAFGGAIAAENPS
ncbi:thiamine phosphate synthase [Halothiobacillus sp. DCM-1]|uniref:thiamine phosphate synthase n=1 Tax=Halothiobacillus sp. DCM-1 TaxID=3112558 RepID=UPI00324925D5